MPADLPAHNTQVVFTALPILIYALLDRPARDSVLLAHPTLYASSGRVVNLYSFWIEGIVLGVVHGGWVGGWVGTACKQGRLACFCARTTSHAWSVPTRSSPYAAGLPPRLPAGAVCFFVPFLSLVPHGILPATTLAFFGKEVYIALLGAVTLEVHTYRGRAGARTAVPLSVGPPINHPPNAQALPGTVVRSRSTGLLHPHPAQMLKLITNALLALVVGCHHSLVDDHLRHSSVWVLACCLPHFCRHPVPGGEAGPASHLLLATAHRGEHACIDQTLLFTS
jgi:hypothetical protein